MNQLNSLLRDASADAPPDHFDPETVVGAGRSRVRRRRALAGVATAAVVGLATIPFVLPNGGSDPAPAAPTVRELTLADAVFAVPGADYSVQDRFTAHATDDAIDGDIVRGVLLDGRVVIQRYLPGRPSQVGTIVEGSPALAEVPPDAVNYLGASDTTIVFASQTRGLWLLDAERLTWRHVLESTDVNPNQTAQPMTGNAGRVYIASARESGRGAGPIYEVDLGRDKAVEIARGGDVAAYGGRVAWTSAADAPVTNVSVREQDGSMTSFDPNTGDCIGIDVGITADRVVLMTNCEPGAGDNEYTDIVTRVDVFDLEGNPVARINGDDDMGPVRMTDRYLTLSRWKGYPAGTYVYDLDSGRFLRMTDQVSGLAGHETGAGSTVVWAERLDGATGARYVVAEMR